MQSHSYAGRAYYITQATQKRQRLFGLVVKGGMRLTPAGEMVHAVWREIPQHCPAYEIDEFIVMPDHIHGVVFARDVEDARYHDYRAAARGERPSNRATLFDFMHRLKSLTTARYRHGVEQEGWPRFDGRVWQREYYEHIVRYGGDLERIRAYIRDNPKNADLLRFGKLRYAGNRALLNLKKTAFLASRTGAHGGAPRHENQHCRGAPPWAPQIKNAQCVISGFISQMERAVLRFCLQQNIPTIQIAAHEIEMRDNSADLVIWPGGTESANLNAARAAWCNQYALDLADDILIGQLNPDGMLALLLNDLPVDKPVEILPAKI